MTIQGAIADLQYLLEADDVPFYYKGGIKKIIETIQMEIADRKTEPQRDCFLCKWLGEVNVCGRCRNRNLFAEADTEPQTDCSWK